MELKKSPKKNLEKKRSLFLQIGLIISLAIVLLAFEWKSYEKQEINLEQREVGDIPEELAQITVQEEAPPPPPPPAPKTTTELNIVEDDVEVDTDVIIDAEADEDTEVEEYIAPVVEEEEDIEEEKVFMIVEQAAKFPGGEAELFKFLSANISYPQLARESGIQGMVFVTFVVEKNGSITDVKILRGIGGGCDEEAIRVVKKMPKWTPGKQRGKPVRSQFRLPVKFRLQ